MEKYRDNLKVGQVIYVRTKTMGGPTTYSGFDQIINFYAHCMT
tara:strand:+ start:292 stop:420 length:129 start_codon:yes stop_codon:yes gene_type:complete